MIYLQYKLQPIVRIEIGFQAKYEKNHDAAVRRVAVAVVSKICRLKYNKGKVSYRD